MENDDNMRRLMEQLLPTFCPNTISRVNPDSFVPNNYITKDFFYNIYCVLSTKLHLILKRWKTFFAISCLKALSSKEMYLRYVMFACDFEIELLDDIFDKLLSACVIMTAFNMETFENTEVNFCELTADIFMVYYKSALKKPFLRHGGFEQFEVYLRFEYLTWECYFNQNKVSNDPDSKKVLYLKNAYKNLDKEHEKFSYQPEFIKHDYIIKNDYYQSLAKEVLSSTKIKLPSLPSLDYLMAKLYAVRQRRAIRLEESETAAVLKHKTTEENSKHKPKSKTTKGDSNAKMTAGDSKLKTTAGDSKLKTTGGDSKLKATGGHSKLKATGGHSKLKATGGHSKLKTTGGQLETTLRGLQRCSNSETNNVVLQKANNTWCDDIVRIAIKYNNSNCSDPAYPNGEFQKEAGKILEHFGDKIKNLIEVLDEYEKE